MIGIADPDRHSVATSEDHDSDSGHDDDSDVDSDAPCQSESEDDLGSDELPDYSTHGYVWQYTMTMIALHNRRCPQNMIDTISDCTLIPRSGE